MNDYRVHVLHYYVVEWQKQCTDPKMKDLSDWLSNTDPTMKQIAADSDRVSFILNLLSRFTSAPGDYTGKALLYDIKHHLIELLRT